MYAMSVRIKWQDIIDRVRGIVDGHNGGVTVRQVVYRLVAEGLLPNTARPTASCPPRRTASHLVCPASRRPAVALSTVESTASRSPATHPQRSNSRIPE